MRAFDKCKKLEKDFGIAMYEEFNEEVYTMCNLSAGVFERGISQGFSQGISQGVAQGISQGIAQGTNRMLQLSTHLFSLGRIEDLKKASSDEAYLQKLFLEFGL